MPPSGVLKKHKKHSVDIARKDSSVWRKKATKVTSNQIFKFYNTGISTHLKL